MRIGQKGIGGLWGWRLCTDVDVRLDWRTGMVVRNLVRGNSKE